MKNFYKQDKLQQATIAYITYFLTPSEEIVEMNGFIIDREKYLIKKDNLSINLPKKEFELISLLASRPGKVFTREDILKNVWGDDVVVGDRTIDVHIRKIREKLGDHYVTTVKGVGYKF